MVKYMLSYLRCSYVLQYDIYDLICIGQGCIKWRSIQVYGLIIQSYGKLFTICVYRNANIYTLSNNRCIAEEV